MEEKNRSANGRFVASIVVGLAVWGLALAWYLHCKNNGSVYGGAFLAVNAPGIPGGVVGYWIYRWWGDGSASGTLYAMCEMGLPSITLCLTWVNLCYQGLTMVGREERTDPSAVRRILLALIPFVVGWCVIPFIIARLAA